MEPYEETRFESTVDENYYCTICMNVLKDPVMCQRNEHYFCNECITKHLENFKTCPTCMEELTTETLRQPPRIVTSCLFNLKIRCDYCQRGCREIVRLEDLKSHVDDCGFSPVVCSNDGCRMEINKRDRTYHESEGCDFRKFKCHDCAEVKKELVEIKVQLEVMKEGIERDAGVKKELVEMKVQFEVMKEDVRKEQDEVKLCLRGIKDDVKNVKQSVQGQLEVMKEDVRKEQDEVKLCLQGIKDDVKQSVQGQLEVLKEDIIKSVKEAVHHNDASSSRRPESREDIVVVGGERDGHRLHSVEMFKWQTKEWLSLPDTKICSDGNSLVVHNNQIIAVGGGFTERMEKLSLLDNQDCGEWSDFPAKLPKKFDQQKCLVDQDCLFMIGGICQEVTAESVSDCIYEIGLIPPYTTKLLASMPQPRCYHGVECFDSDIFIFGGSTEIDNEHSLDSVLKYDVVNNGITEAAPLPFAMNGMATVTCGDHAVIMGGCDKNGEVLNTVMMYSFKTGKSKMLPSMIHNREGAVAVKTRNVIVVMGGENKEWSSLSSVECFSFDRYSWEELPPMKEARSWAAAVLKPQSSYVLV